MYRHFRERYSILWKHHNLKPHKIAGTEFIYFHMFISFLCSYSITDTAIRGKFSERDDMMCGVGRILYCKLKVLIYSYTFLSDLQFLKIHLVKHMIL